MEFATYHKQERDRGYKIFYSDSMHTELCPPRRNGFLDSTMPIPSTMDIKPDITDLTTLLDQT